MLIYSSYFSYNLNRWNLNFYLWMNPDEVFVRTSPRKRATRIDTGTVSYQEATKSDSLQVGVLYSSNGDDTTRA